MNYHFKSILKLILTAFFLFTSKQIKAELQTIKDERKILILSPSFQERKTEKIRLKNGLEAYLISDPQAKQSAASLAVDVGSFDEPNRFPGLAHYVEHLLFLGTEKFPEEGSYHRYINEHQGKTNAFTSSKQTSFLFSINHDAFEEALDRFSSFFISPSFNPSGVSRELHAIDEEYKKNLDNDHWRIWHVLKSFGNKSHPISKFDIGNIETLSDIPLQEVKKWYRKNYSANKMHLVIYSSLSLEKLRQLVTQNFSSIPSFNIEKKSFSPPLLDPSFKGVRIDLPPKKQMQSLILIWELPSFDQPLIETHADSIVAYILGYEGPFSLLSQLKEEGLAEGISSGSQKLDGDRGIFQIEVSLTNKGANNIQTVIERIFQAINRLKKEGVPKQLFNDIQQLAKIQYQYQERKDAYTQVSLHTQRITKEPIESYPEKTVLYHRYSPRQINLLIHSLTPSNALYFVVLPQDQSLVTYDKKDPWFHVPYRLTPMKEKSLSDWENIAIHPKIHIPKPNPFIPSSLDIIYQEKSAEKKLIITPQLIENSDYAKIYFAQDKQYLSPSIYFSFQIKTPQIIPSNIKSVVLSDLFIKAFNEDLREISYQAALAGLKLSIKTIDNGFQITFSGFSDKSNLFLKEIFQSLSQIEISPNFFEDIKYEQKRAYQSSDLESPLSLAIQNFKQVLYQFYPSNHEKIKALDELTFSDFNQFLSTLFEKSYIEGIFYGNISLTQAKDNVKNIKQALIRSSYPKNQHFIKKLTSFGNTPYFFTQKTSLKGSALILGIKAFDHYSFQKQAAQQIMMQMIKEPFFSHLRTKQQVGYIVFSWDENIDNHLYNFFAAQSSIYPPQNLLVRFEQFLEQHLRELLSDPLTEKRFSLIKNSFIKNLQTPPESLELMGKHLAEIIFDHKQDFLWMEKRIKAFNQITFEEYTSMLKEVFSSKNKKRLSIGIIGELDESKRIDYKTINSIIDLKKYYKYN